MTFSPRPEPEPRRDPPRSPGLPAPRPRNKWTQDRERAEIRRQLREQSPWLRPVAPERVSAPPMEKVPLLRQLARRALFSPADPGKLAEPQPPAQVKDMHGDLRLYGHRLSWWDLRTLAWVCHEFRRQRESARRRPELVLNAHRLAAELHRPHDPGQRAVDRASRSLLRLTQAQFCFTFAVSDQEEQQIGTPERPQTMLRRDFDHGPPDVYALSGWLHRLLQRGVERPATGLIQYGIEWPVMRALDQRQLILYLLLECHDWEHSKRERCEFDADSGFDTRTRYWLLKSPFLATLGLLSYEPPEYRRQLKRIADAISARDYRYTFDLKGDRLHVWRDRSKTDRWLGPLCSRCGEPDPNRSCCCDQPRRCGRDGCSRCQR